MSEPVTTIVRPRTPGFDTATLLKFVMSGASTAILFLLLCFGFTKAGMDPFAASLAAYAIGFMAGYALQRWWTFEARHRHGKALPRYFILQAGCALLSGIVSRYGVLWLHLTPLPMATLTACITGGASFFLSRYWVFPHEGSDSEQPV